MDALNLALFTVEVALFWERLPAPVSICSRLARVCCWQLPFIICFHILALTIYLVRQFRRQVGLILLRIVLVVARVIGNGIKLASTNLPLLLLAIWLISIEGWDLSSCCLLSLKPNQSFVVLN